MKTYYIVEKNGYRKGVKGRRVQVYGWFKTFYHIDNGEYIIRDIKTSFILGRGETLGEAKKASISFIKNITDKSLDRWLKKVERLQGPKGGK